MSSSADQQLRAALEAHRRFLDEWRRQHEPLAKPPTLRLIQGGKSA